MCSIQFSHRFRPPLHGFWKSELPSVPHQSSTRTSSRAGELGSLPERLVLPASLRQARLYRLFGFASRRCGIGTAYTDLHTALTARKSLMLIRCGESQTVIVYQVSNTAPNKDFLRCGPDTRCISRSRGAGPRSLRFFSPRAHQRRHEPANFDTRRSGARRWALTEALALAPGADS